MRRAARIFVADASKPAIIAALHQCGPNGFFFEQDTPEILAAWRNPIEVAAAARNAIERFSLKIVSHRHSRLTDWPAFRASKCRSISAFEAAYNRVWIAALNEAELFYEASIEPRGEEDISLHVTINRCTYNAEMGRKLLKLIDACAEWEATA